MHKPVVLPVASGSHYRLRAIAIVQPPARPGLPDIQRLQQSQRDLGLVQGLGRIDEQRLAGTRNTYAQYAQPGPFDQPKRHRAADQCLKLRTFCRQLTHKLARRSAMQARECLAQGCHRRIVWLLLPVIHLLKQLAPPCRDLRRQCWPVVLSDARQGTSLRQQRRVLRHPPKLQIVQQGLQPAVDQQALYGIDQLGLRWPAVHMQRPKMVCIQGMDGHGLVNLFIIQASETLTKAAEHPVLVCPAGRLLGP
ncbi:hypothetical protein D3C75_729720 [compost metagenome]